MEKIRFGKTELMVSKVAFGGIPIMRVPKDEAVKLVRETISLGINFIDTAHGYADSEEKIGEAIKGIKREELIIATKSPANDKKTFNEHLDLSLKRLGTDYIDIMQLHNIGSTEKRDACFAADGAYEGLQEAVKAGKVRFPGFSSHSLELCIEIMKSGKFDAVQFPFNFIDDAAAKEAIPLAKKLDIGFIAMKPMGGGRLDSAELAFRYLLQFENIIPDPGIEKIEEIREIAQLVENKPILTEEDKKTIEKLRAEFGATWCHRCDYCQPCPQGIDINWVLSAESCKKRFTLERFKLMLGQPIERAKTCLECNQCKARCPYHLDIPALIKENIAFFDRTAG
ncbi:MAG: aldo/keto reductase [Treponema sp.]|jgi:predicted aldo/keto reductase-like oxidoreductase|nr:aldo/keto reductase [Treponema sp.]